jgi:hypothetical protein
LTRSRQILTESQKKEKSKELPSAPNPPKKSTGIGQVSSEIIGARLLARHIRETLKDLTFPEDVVVTVDINPYSMG